MVYRIKVIIIGEPGVGKTSLVKKYVTDQFTSDYRSSIGTNIFRKKLELGSNESISIQLWDIAGQERWVKMRQIYYKGTNGALIVGDLTRANTFTQIEDFWHPEVKKYCNDIPIMLIGNKTDLKFQISRSEVATIGERLKINSTSFTSAKNGENVENTFELISKFALKLE